MRDAAQSPTVGTPPCPARWPPAMGTRSPARPPTPPPAWWTPAKLEARVKSLVVAGPHVRELLPCRECADVMRDALAELGRGQIQQPLRTIVRPRDAAGFMGLMPAYSP